MSTSQPARANIGPIPPKTGAPLNRDITDSVLQKSIGVTVLEPPKGESFFVGNDPSLNDTRIIAATTAVQVEIRAGNREFTGQMGLHEIPLYRALYDAKTGGASIRIDAYWPPGLSRHIKLTATMIRHHIENLRASSVVRLENSAVPIVMFDEYYGKDISLQPKRLVEVMRKQLEAFNALYLDVESRMRLDPEMSMAKKMSVVYSAMVVSDIEKIVALADPFKATSNIELDGVMALDSELVMEAKA